MEQKILVLYYSQAGQTLRAAQTFADGVSEISQNSPGDSICCDLLSYSVEPEFAFPWSPTGFFAVFPRCHAGPLPKLNLPKIDWAQYDRIVLASQVWFLSPSLPFQAFLASSDASHLRGKNVLTLVTCRNLWQSAYLSVSTKLKKIGAVHLGQITICENGPVWASFVTTPRWMLTGKKEAFAFFPAAGIPDFEFLKLKARTRMLAKQWLREPIALTPPFSPILECNLNRVSLLLMDRVGNRFFKIWSAILRCAAPQPGALQNFWLILFRLTLISLIVTLGPCTKLIELLVGNDPRWFGRPIAKTLATQEDQPDVLQKAFLETPANT